MSKNKNRSRKVFECWVCGALTNKITYGKGSFGRDYRILCPQSSEHWHHKLEKKAELLFQPHPKSYREELVLEVLAIRKLHEHQIKSDLKGKLDAKKREWIEDVRSYKDVNSLYAMTEGAFELRRDGLRFLRQRTH